MSEWISVKEMLPGVHRHVLVYMPNVENTPDMAVGYLENDLNFYFFTNGKDPECNIDALEMDLVTHWMPLPSTEGL